MSISAHNYNKTNAALSPLGVSAGRPCMELLISILVGLCLIEVYAWLPVLSQWVLERAVSRLPAQDQERCREEWKASLGDHRQPIACVRRRHACAATAAGGRARSIRARTGPGAGRLRSSALNLTTYFLTAISFPATNHLHRWLAVTEIQKFPSRSMTRATSETCNVPIVNSCTPVTRRCCKCGSGASAGQKAWDARLMSRERPLLNGMYFDEIQAPKSEFRDYTDQRTQTLAHPCARRSFAVGLATRLAPAVRP